MAKVFKKSSHTMMEPFRTLPLLDYGQFINVYGNKFRHLHFIAMCFKREIISYKTFNSISIKTPIQLPSNSIIVVRGSHPPFQSPPQSVLLFTVDGNYKDSINVTDSSTNTLLRALFPPSKILYSHFAKSTLFIVAWENPYSKIMKKCKREAAFHTLVSVVNAKTCNRLLTLEEIANLRFFKRTKEPPSQFNRWSPLAFHLCYESCRVVTNALPSECLAREIFKILKRSADAPDEIMDSNFYQCEIYFTDSDPVGIMSFFSNDKFYHLEYVSPMVVKQIDKEFKDCNSIECNTWLPFYKNKATWETDGLRFYVNNLNLKKKQLLNILLWLQIQTVEKFKLFYMDLIQVAKILFGENETRWFLKL